MPLGAGEDDDEEGLEEEEEPEEELDDDVDADLDVLPDLEDGLDAIIGGSDAAGRPRMPGEGTPQQGHACCPRLSLQVALAIFKQ
jgi:hypothetical protein